MRVPVEVHDFQKLNIISKKGGHDIVECRFCGAKGKRFLAEVEMDTRFKKAAGCNYRGATNAPENSQEVEILVDESLADGWGLKAGMRVKTVEVPGQKLSGVWVMSPTFPEPIRLVPREYRVV